MRPLIIVLEGFGEDVSRHGGNVLLYWLDPTFLESFMELVDRHSMSTAGGAWSGCCGLDNLDHGLIVSMYNHAGFRREKRGPKDKARQAAMAQNMAH